MNRFSVKISISVIIISFVVLFLWFKTDFFNKNSSYLNPDDNSKPNFMPYSQQWDIDTTYVYELEWQAEQSQNVSLASASTTSQTSSTTTIPLDKNSKNNKQLFFGSLNLNAVLLLKPMGKNNNGNTLILVRPDKITSVKYNLMSKDLLPLNEVSAATYVSQNEYIIEVEPRGKIVGLRFFNNTPEVIKQFAQHLFAEFQVVFPGNRKDDTESKWTTRELTGIGDTEIEYNLLENNNLKTLEFSKKRLKYLNLPTLAKQQNQSNQSNQFNLSNQSNLKLISDTKITFDNNNKQITSFFSNETVDAINLTTTGQEEKNFTYKNTLKIYFKGKNLTGFDIKRKTNLADIISLENRLPGESVVSAETEKYMLNQRIGGLTLQTLKNKYKTMANTGLSEDRNRFIWQATGLLKQHPEYAKELVPIFKANISKGDIQNRALIADLLANTGNIESQKALREILADNQVKNLQEYNMLFQRMSIISNADVDTEQFVANTFMEAKKSQNKSLEYSSANSLGAIIRSRISTINDNLESKKSIEKLNDELVNSLRSAENTKEQLAYISALGNAGLEKNIEVIVNYTQDNDPSVRAAAATSLRKTENENSRQIIRNMFADNNPLVQRAVIETFIRYQQTNESKEFFSQALLSGKIKVEVFGLVVKYIETNIINDNSVDKSIAKEMLEYVAKHENKDDELKVYVNTLLQAYK